MPCDVTFHELFAAATVWSGLRFAYTALYSMRHLDFSGTAK
ncbi:unnamed protein product [Callosobruchus maculatus]|uniref:Uncharacterized protein n=1 Tax=Callosobruchus maculatus TaxID=64391 RepID=A0A653CJH7_CALMS|nr:unnamed protein product [Callosobruchus maculatus]